MFSTAKAIATGIPVDMSASSSAKKKMSVSHQENSKPNSSMSRR